MFNWGVGLGSISQCATLFVLLALAAVSASYAAYCGVIRWTGNLSVVQDGNLHRSAQLDEAGFERVNRPSRNSRSVLLCLSLLFDRSAAQHAGAKLSNTAIASYQPLHAGPPSWGVHSIGRNLAKWIWHLHWR